MDLLNAINMKRVFSKDAFQPGKAYRIKIHDIDKMVKMMRVSNASDYDDDDMTSYTRYIKGLFKQFDTDGFDAICVALEDDYAVFSSSYFGRLSNKIMPFDIKIDIDTFYDFAKSDELQLAPDVEILEMKPTVPDVLFRDTDKKESYKNGKKNPKESGTHRWIKHMPPFDHGDDSTATGDNR